MHNPTDHPQEVADLFRRTLRQRTTWNDTPDFGFISTGPLGIPELWPLKVPPRKWDEMRPTQFLANIGQVLDRPRGLAQQRISDRIRSLTPPHLFGIYYLGEFWGAPDHMKPLLRKRHSAGLPPLDYSQLPDPVQSRAVAAVDTTGRRYSAIQTRHGTQIILTGWTDTVGRYGNGDAHLERELYVALRRILTAQKTPPTVPNTITRS